MFLLRDEAALIYWLYTVVELIVVMLKQRLKDALCQEQRAILLAMVAIPQ